MTTPGEVAVLPLHPSMELDVREHAFLAGTHSLTYSFVRIKGLANVTAKFRCCCAVRRDARRIRATCFICTAGCWSAPQN